MDGWIGCVQQIEYNAGGHYIVEQVAHVEHDIFSSYSLYTHSQ